MKMEYYCREENGVLTCMFEYTANMDNPSDNIDVTARIRRDVKTLIMVLRDKLFCDKNFTKITLGIKIVWKFISEGVNMLIYKNVSKWPANAND